MQMDTKEFDIIIVGGGMIGAAMALGLAKQNCRVALVEKQSLKPFKATQAPDLRLSAFNLHSVNLLTTLGAWQHVLDMRYREYEQLSVWEQSETKTSFKADDIGEDKLGYFVENRLIQLALYQQIKAQYAHLVDTIHKQDIQQIDIHHASITLSSGDVYKAKLIIGADGANSQVRKAANIATSGWQYGQQANAILIKTPQQHAPHTWQEFHVQGPRAFLPMHDNYACLVWYDNKQQSQWIQQAQFAQLSDAIVRHFPAQLGEFEIKNVAGFGLTRMHAHNYGRAKAIILGDAAHTINPLAGQGVNLGFKDVAALLDIIADKGLMDTAVLISEFEKRRKIPNLLMMSTMDILYSTFSTPLLPIKIARNIGLKVAQQAGPIKQKALQYAMGV